MQTKRLAGAAVRVDASRYTLEIRPQDATVLLDVKGTRQRYLLFPGGACNTTGKRDETERLGPVSVRRRKDAREIAVPHVSTAWRQKTSFFICRERSIEFYHLLVGRGQMDRVHYFRGYLAGEERGFAGDFDEIYATAPNFQERLHYHPADAFFISFGNNLTVNCGGHALASPCHCMGLHDRRDKAHVSVGLAAQPGAYTWDDMWWNPTAAIAPTPFPPDGVLGGGFAADYGGKLTVRGPWESPRLVITFAKDQEDVLPSYLRHCYAHGYLPRPERHTPASWWLEPIYCTWHDQVALARATTDRDGRGGAQSALDFCTQQRTDHWVRLLERKHCKPGIVILDAAWQENLNSGEPDPAKWPAMRDWVEQCHARDIRVFVWSAAWSTDGLPPQECITRDGEPVACDITNPTYEKRFREMIRKWFSDAPDCLNADGIKMDGLLGLPTGKGLRNHAGLWGLELQRRYLQVLHEEAHKHKADVCVSTFVANPYLAESTDMVRIADMYTHRLTAHETMLHRAEVYRQTMPYAVIDTDGQFSHYMLNNYADELSEQARIGVPTLYNAENVFQQRFFQPTRIAKMTDSDYREFARVFAAYRRQVRASQRRGSGRKAD